MLATVRDHIADYVGALFFVYAGIIIAYILSSMYFTVGGRLPYARWSSAILNFLRDTSEPCLRFFRRFVPMVGPLDLSPLVALIVLSVGGNLLVGLIKG
jgi:YggT family protein